MTVAARTRREAARSTDTTTGLSTTAISSLASALTSSDVRRDRVAPAPSGIAVRLARVFATRSSGNGQMRDRRRTMPIRCYLGANGSGKSLMAVRDFLPSLDAGRLVYSTVPLLDAATGEVHPGYRPFRDWDDFMHAENADFFADEISSIAASRDHNNLHSDVIARLHQLRKIDVTFAWTAPSWKRADTALREVTWVVTECKGFYADHEATKGDGAVLWAPHRMFRAITYDMAEFDEWTAGKRESARGVAREWFWGPGSREFGSYRTLDAVDRLEPYNPRSCVVCGLTRRVEYCRGH